MPHTRLAQRISHLQYWTYAVDDLYLHMRSVVCMSRKHMHMWQSQVEIEDYSRCKLLREMCLKLEGYFCVFQQLLHLSPEASLAFFYYCLTLYNKNKAQKHAKSYGTCRSQVYSRQLTGLASNIQVAQGFSASHGPFAFILRSRCAQTIDKYPSKHTNCSLS